MAKPSVLQLTGPIILDWGNGMRLQIGPLEASPKATAPVVAPAAVALRRGRKPGPGTQALIEILHVDAAVGKRQDRKAYLKILRNAGHEGSLESAKQVVNRELHRVFPNGSTTPVGKAVAPKGNRKGGRKPGPATQALVKVLQHDAASTTRQATAIYLGVLRRAGHEGSEDSARQIVAREVRRAFSNAPAARSAKTAARVAARKGGRQVRPEVALVRAKIADDVVKGQKREATHYVRWLVDQPENRLGLKGARPLVYRELRLHA